ncbi:MAG: hypothetical protein HRU09_18760, partial [Oligoflexales bacterium]|nr:hypothetical protein [Oligoflexales bacterium]
MAEENSQVCEPSLKIDADTIKKFYQEWEAGWGPALTSLDRDFLESASPEVAAKVTPNKYSTHYSCVIRTLYFGRNG